MKLNARLTLMGYVGIFVLITVATIVNFSFVRTAWKSALDDKGNSLAAQYGVIVAEGIRNPATVRQTANRLFELGELNLLRIEVPLGDPLFVREKEQPVPTPWYGINAASTDVRLFAEGQPVGRLMISVASEQANSEIGRGLVNTLLYEFVLLVACCIAYHFVLPRIIAPWERLHEAVGAVKDGLSGVALTAEEKELTGCIWDTIEGLQTKLKRALQEQLRLTNYIREHTFNDETTGLANRQFFERRLEVAVRGRDEATQGVLMLLQLKDFETAVEMVGTEVTNDLLLQTAHLIENATTRVKGAVVAHLKDGDFAILAPQTTIQEAQKLSKNLLKNMRSLPIPSGMSQLDLGHIGLSIYGPGSEPYQVLSEADMALRSAQLQGPNSYFGYEQGHLDASSIKGSVRWRVMLERIIEQREIRIFFQPVVASDDAQSVLFHEVFTRVVDDQGKLVSGAIYLPMAHRCGLQAKLDRLVVGQVIKYLLHDGNDFGDCSINISAESLVEPLFNVWLMQKLAELPHLAKRLIFEFSEYSIDSNIDQFLPELERLRELGVRIAVDHVGQAYATINYLEQITPQYLKLHSSIIRLLDREREHHVFIQSVVQLASNVHCCVLAEGIETEAEWMQAKSLGLSGGQGFYLGRPMQKK
ncbi:MAG: hypothetical protein CMF25_06455 [Kangiellaceae bacterium]|nr:hypothetical protein [Kangiellaceae bacterium]